MQETLGGTGGREKRGVELAIGVVEGRRGDWGGLQNGRRGKMNGAMGQIFGRYGCRNQGRKMIWKGRS